MIHLIFDFFAIKILIINKMSSSSVKNALSQCINLAVLRAYYAFRLLIFCLLMKTQQLFLVVRNLIDQEPYKREDNIQISKNGTI